MASPIMSHAWVVVCPVGLLQCAFRLLPFKIWSTHVSLSYAFDTWIGSDVTIIMLIIGYDVIIAIMGIIIIIGNPLVVEYIEGRLAGPSQESCVFELHLSVASRPSQMAGSSLLCRWGRRCQNRYVFTVQERSTLLCHHVHCISLPSVRGES